MRKLTIRALLLGLMELLMSLPACAVTNSRTEGQTEEWLEEIKVMRDSCNAINMMRDTTYYWIITRGVFVPEHRQTLNEAMSAMYGCIRTLLNKLDDFRNNISSKTEEDFNSLKREFSYYCDEIIFCIRSFSSNIIQGKFSCNKGGCIKLGEGITIRDSSSEYCYFYSKAFAYNNYLIVYKVQSIYASIIPDEGYGIKTIRMEGWDYEPNQTSFVDDQIVFGFSVDFYKIGDANGDDVVSVADVVAVVNYLLTNGSPTGQFVASAADVDGIDGITIADALAIANIVLGM